MPNLVKQPTRVGRDLRKRLNGHRSMVLWLTGYSGAVKSTIAMAVEESLTEKSYHAIVLDGDNLRHGLCNDLGFTLKDRSENIRRVAEVAKLFMEAGMIVITSFISPLISDRERARALFHDEDFFEIFCDSSLGPVNTCGAHLRSRRNG